MGNNKLNFCPYETDISTKKFKSIDMTNLAYEIIFMKPYNFDVLRNTILAGKTDIIKKGEDVKLKLLYNDNSVHYMLWAAPKGGVSGISRLLKAIDESNEKTDINPEDEYEGVNFDDTNIPLEYEIEESSGSYIISFATDSIFGKIPIMKAVPCCPNCHMRLPVGWVNAEEFCPISLLGRTGGGKTTYKLSLMANEWDALRNIKSGWIINAAHETAEGFDYWYTQLSRAAKIMAVENGECPPNTQTEKWVSPLFMALNINGHKMIVGLYDNSGETLKEMTSMDPRIILLSNMYAHIYIIEPEQMPLKLRDNKEENFEDKKYFEDVEIMTVEEQGAFQKENMGKMVRAIDLINPPKSQKNKIEHKEDVLSMLKNYQRLLQQMGVIDRMKNQHLCATVIKCDLLEGLSEIESINHSQFLFQHGRPSDIFNLRRAREEIIEELFKKYVFIRDEQSDFIEGAMGSYSYHCVSALGCDTYVTNEDREIIEFIQGKEVKGIENMKINRLKGEYNPIRVAEPLAYCLEKKIKECGW